MRKLYFLCFLTLAAVILDFVFLHSGSVYAQQTQSGIQIQRIPMATQNSTNRPVSGRVVGFSCISIGAEGNVQDCFVATSPN